MGGIYKKHPSGLFLAVPRGFFEPGYKLIVVEVELELRIEFRRDTRALFECRPHLLHHATALAIGKLDTGEPTDALCSSFRISYWHSFE